MKKLIVFFFLLFGLSVYLQAADSTTAPEGYTTMHSTSISHHAMINKNEVAARKQILMIRDNLPWNSEADTVVMDELGYGYDVKPWAEVGIDVFRQYPIVLIVNDQGQQFYDDYATHKPEIEQWIREGGTLMFFSASDGWAGGSLNAPLPGDVAYNKGYDYTNIVNPASTYVQFTNLVDEDMESNYASHGYYDTLDILLGNANIHTPEVHILTDDYTAPTVISYRMNQGYVFASTLTWEHNWNKGVNSTFGRKALAKTFEYVVIHSGQNAIPPKVFLSANTYSGPTPLTVRFSANASDIDGYIVEYQWDFNGDGKVDETSKTDSIEHTFTSDGDYNVKVKALDNDGFTGSSSVMVYARAGLPIVTVTPFVQCNELKNSCEVEFTLFASGNYSGSFDWDFDNDGSIDAQMQGPGKISHTYGLNAGTQIYTVKYEGNIVFRDFIVLTNALADFNKDGSSDLLWRNSATGGARIWHMRGMNKLDSVLALASSNTNLIPQGVGDFNNDGYPDIVLRNSNSGMVRVWIMNDTTRLDNIQVLSLSNTNLVIAGVSDFNRDGYLDIAVFNKNTGALRIWLMRETERIDNVLVLTGANTNLMPRGAGDMDGNGIPDIVLRNNNSGAVRVWTMTPELTRTGNFHITSSSNVNLKIRGISDINGDGFNDILNYNTNSGALRAWIMDGHMSTLGNSLITIEPNLNWSVRN